MKPISKFNSTCLLCNETFNDPVTCLCNHTFCYICLKKLVGKSTCWNCPQCNKPHNILISKLPRNSRLKHLISKQNPSVLSCKRECPNHPDRQVQAFCKECNAVICLVCIIKNHKHHDIDEIDAVVSGLQVDLTACLNTLNDYKVHIARLNSEQLVDWFRSYVTNAERELFAGRLLQQKGIDEYSNAIKLVEEVQTELTNTELAQEFSIIPSIQRQYEIARQKISLICKNFSIDNNDDLSFKSMIHNLHRPTNSSKSCELHGDHNQSNDIAVLESFNDKGDCLIAESTLSASMTKEKSLGSSIAKLYSENLNIKRPSYIHYDPRQNTYWIANNASGEISQHTLFSTKYKVYTCYGSIKMLSSNIFNYVLAVIDQKGKRSIHLYDETFNLLNNKYLSDVQMVRLAKFAPSGDAVCVTHFDVKWISRFKKSIVMPCARFEIKEPVQDIAVSMHGDLALNIRNERVDLYDETGCQFCFKSGPIRGIAFDYYGNILLCQGDNIYVVAVDGALKKTIEGDKIGFVNPHKAFVSYANDLIVFFKPHNVELQLIVFSNYSNILKQCAS